MFTMLTYLKKIPNMSDLNILTHTEHSVLNTCLSRVLRLFLKK